MGPDIGQNLVGRKVVSIPFAGGDRTSMRMDGLMTDEEQRR
jgi:hypothetical protein